VIWPFAIALASYLIGSIPSGYIAGKIAGIDIRKAGSGNIGATNVTRTLGKKYGYPVFAADFSKGPLAILTADFLFHRFVGSGPIVIAEIIAAVCCVLGNAFPLWLGFRGGKGVAVSAGLLFALMPWAALTAILVWLIVFYLSGYVSLASILAAAMMPLVVLALLYFHKMSEWPFLYVSIALTTFVVLRHRTNISRLVHGTEQRFRKSGD